MISTRRNRVGDRAVSPTPQATTGHTASLLQRAHLLCAPTKCPRKNSSVMRDSITDCLPVRLVLFLVGCLVVAAAMATPLAAAPVAAAPLAATPAAATQGWTRMDRMDVMDLLGGGRAEDTATTVDTGGSSVMGWESAMDGGGTSCTLTKLANLNFGAIFVSPALGTVCVSPKGVASYTGGVYAHTGVAGYTVSAALVQLTLYNKTHCQHDHQTSDNNEYSRNEDDDGRTDDNRTSFNRHGGAVALSVSRSSTLKRSGGTETMTADTFTLCRNNGNTAIGATLHVAANQKSGSYSGTFSVTTICQ